MQPVFSNYTPLAFQPAPISSFYPAHYIEAFSQGFHPQAISHQHPPFFYYGTQSPLPHTEEPQSTPPQPSPLITQQRNNVPPKTSELGKDSKVKEQPSSVTPSAQPHITQHLETLKQSSRARRGKNSGDGEYRPNCQERRVVRKRIHENANRNILPNELHQIVSFLVKRNRSGELLARVMTAHPSPAEEYTAGRFFLYMGVLKEKIAQNGSQQGVALLGKELEEECMVWERAEQQYYCKILRVMVRHFLKEEGVCGVLTSKRMVASRKKGHLEISRHLENRIMGRTQQALQ